MKLVQFVNTLYEIDKDMTKLDNIKFGEYEADVRQMFLKLLDIVRSTWDKVKGDLWEGEEIAEMIDDTLEALELLIEQDSLTLLDALNIQAYIDHIMFVISALMWTPSQAVAHVLVFLAQTLVKKVQELKGGEVNAPRE